MSRVAAVTIILILVAACSADVPLSGVDAPAPTAFTLTVDLDGAGTGTVVSSPAGIDCGADCTEAYTAGTSVTLVAAPAAGSTFTGWSGVCMGTGTCTVSLSSDATVIATFTPSAVCSLTATVVGNGTVTSNPAGINCGADCTEIYGCGTLVTLVATPAAGAVFAGWSGDCGGTGSCTVTGPTAVTATFVAGSSLLTVTRSGAGTGTVVSSPAGVTCGADCSEIYASGTTVVLTATPAAGSSFLGWNGGGCTGTGTCTVTLAGNVTVDAVFDLGSCSVTAVRSGPGTGTISSAPSGIACGAACQAPFPCGTIVTLTAAPTAGSTFTGWSGAGCSGTGTCAVGVSGDITVTGNFGVP